MGIEIEVEDNDQKELRAAHAKAMGLVEKSKLAELDARKAVAQLNSLRNSVMLKYEAWGDLTFTSDYGKIIEKEED